MSFFEAVSSWLRERRGDSPLLGSLFGWGGKGGSSGGAGSTSSFEVDVAQEAKNQAAGIAAIRACEGTSAPVAYRALYGYHPITAPGRLFDSFDDHPRRRFWFDGRPVPDDVKPRPYTYTTAAGALQITETTFDRVTRLIGRRDFSPESQVEIGLYLIREAGALGDLRAGRLEPFVVKCSPIWASLPMSKAGQPKKSMDFVRGAYRSAGGKEA